MAGTELFHTKDETREIYLADGKFLSRAPKMDRVHEAIICLAQIDSVPVLVQGETGTGKELVARALHELSPRSSGPFVAINCAAIPEHLLESELFGYEKGAFTDAKTARRGRIEQAHTGTLLLDEIGDMRLDLQAKLLRVLQTKKVERLGSEQTTDLDIRVICTSNIDLRKQVAGGKFRGDLFWRISVACINVPALRSRPEDIPVLMRHYLQIYGEKFGREPIPEISPEAMEKLKNHPWPGNVRELESVVQRALIYSHRSELIGPVHIVLDRISKDTLPVLEVYYGTDIESLNRDYILAILNDVGGNKTRAAKLLGVPLRTLHSHLKRFREQGFYAE